MRVSQRLLLGVGAKLAVVVNDASRNGALLGFFAKGSLLFHNGRNGHYRIDPFSLACLLPYQDLR